MTATGSSTNLVDRILADHQLVKQLLGTFETIPAGGRGQYFCQVVHDLVGHEVAEEELVYPLLRKQAGGDAEADARIAEQSKAEEELKRLEGLDAESEEFRTGFVALRQAVLDHAAHEEAGALPLLRSSVDADELDRLGGRYETAKASAPTHPHPHAPDSPPGNILLGPVAAVIDRVRDALRGA